MARPTIIAKGQDIDLVALADELVVTSAKLQRAQHQISAAGMAHVDADQLAQMKLELDGARRHIAASEQQRDDSAAALAPVSYTHLRAHET